MFKVPVLLIVFNRPEQTKRVLEVLSRIKPGNLFIAADGPREMRGDEEKCQQVREILNKINWKCQVHRLYRKKNLGLEKAVKKAIDWFFDQVPEGIILEDDCLPDDSFFDFCQKMLKKYRTTEIVMAVNGSNFLGIEDQNPRKYFLSKYVHFWGWASWKRAWDKYDGKMNNWPKINKDSNYRRRFAGVWEWLYFYILFSATFQHKVNSWGYKWLFSVWKNGGFGVTGGVNMIKNIGFTPDGTHQVLRKFELKSEKMAKNFNLDKKNSDRFDRLIAKRYFGISPLMVAMQFLYYQIKTSVKPHD